MSRENLKGKFLGEILNLLLKELLEKCFNNPQDNSSMGPRPAGSEPSIPLPIIDDLSSRLPSGAARPDSPAWWAGMIGILSDQQLCRLLKFNATSSEVDITNQSSEVARIVTIAK